MKPPKEKNKPPFTLKEINDQIRACQNQIDTARETIAKNVGLIEYFAHLQRTFTIPQDAPKDAKNPNEVK